MIDRNIRYNSTLSYRKRIVIIRKYTKKTVEKNIMNGIGTAGTAGGQYIRRRAEGGPPSNQQQYARTVNLYCTTVDLKSIELLLKLCYYYSYFYSWSDRASPASYCS